MILTTERQQFAAQNEMSMEFVNWFFDEKKDSFGNMWFLMAAAMWEAWKGRDNREAQPVLYASEETLAYAKEGEKSLVTWSEPMGDAVIPLFTAPPAPANANAVAWEMRYWNSGHNIWGDWERITAEQHAEMSAEHAADNDYEFRVLYDSPPAPAVPEEMKRDPDADVFDPGFMNGWNACRAAMLAQPVSSGYKLPDGWIACSERMPPYGKYLVMHEFGRPGGNLSHAVATYMEFDKNPPNKEIVKDWVCGVKGVHNITHWMPLPAAPEASHDNS
ncbi:DUF551 domain-containing protein [Serratia marcescens]|uniref:DUF551 domain-containing protein n=1 Tax=Serratia marcescens TaxID=615 RepID=UPI0032046FE6